MLREYIQHYPLNMNKLKKILLGYTHPFSQQEDLSNRYFDTTSDEPPYTRA